jgi:RHS repeat-associated protein
LDNPGFREGILWTGTNPPSLGESAELWDVVTNLGDASWTTNVEAFLADYPDGALAASVHHAYASFCRRTGRTTKALEHWEAGWNLVSTNLDDSSVRVGEMILAEWMTLLSSLGRAETLGDLVTAGDQWPFVNPQDREKVLAAKQNYRLMLGYPEISFRCGTLAVKAVGQILQPTNAALESLVDVPSPTNGFSVAQLLGEATARGLDMVAVRRPEGVTDLVVPSVVHWTQNHYAAIVQQGDDGAYLVNDPTFGNRIWLSAQVINEEASGVFLMASNSVPEGWNELSSGEAEEIHGMGLPNTTKDGKDKGCPPRKKCPPCKGMPVSWVSEPYENLWIADEPLSYLTSRGEPFSFRVTYKQRDTRFSATLTNNLTQVWNTGWNNSWLSYLHVEYAFAGCTNSGGMEECLSTNGGILLFLADGGEVDFSTSSYDSETGAQLQPVSPNSITLPLNPPTADNGNNGYRLIWPDGSQDIYGFSLSYTTPIGDAPFREFLRTRHIDANGNTTWFLYQYASRYLLSAVVDYDGRTNGLTYDANSLLTQVTNAYGLSASFGYDANRNLTTLTDAAELTSTLKYDTNGYPTNLVTPYGTNRFEYTFITLSTNGNLGGHDTIDRSVRITEPTGATSLYLYRYDSPSLPTKYPAADVPTNTPLNTLDTGTGGTNNLTAVSFRNSFYWNPRQYSFLSIATNSGSLSNVLVNLTTNDYLRGRMRHWLQDSNELYISGLLSTERDPSPDGVNEGLKTFYDYEGKIYPHRAGTNSQPSVTAWRLPGGETHYDYVRYNEVGDVISRVTTYTRSDGSLGTRTNQFVYLENTYANALVLVGGPGASTNTFSVPNLLTQVTGPDGSNIWTFGGFENVAWSNDFKINSSQSNRIILTSQRVLPRYITNGVGEVTELAFTGFNKLAQVKWSSGLTSSNVYDGSGFLSKTIDQQIGRTNSFAYASNGLPSAVTNALGLALSPVWDGLLRLTKVGFTDGSYVSNRWTRLDIAGSRDRMGNWSYFNYDGLDHLVAVTNANTNVTRYGWCGCGSLESVSNALNQVTTLTHDYQMRCTGVQWPDTNSVTYQYDLAGRATNVLDGLGRSLKYSYNNQGLVTAVSNAYGRVLGAVYDIRDRPIQVTDATGLTVTNVFDNLDRIVARFWPSGGGVEGWLWSTNGLLAYTNRDNKVTRYVRDVAGRLTAVTNANQEVVQFGYNPAGQLTNMVDGLNHTTRWGRNEFGWPTNKVDALGREAFRFGYNLNGWLTNRWTPEFGNTAYVRDPLGNVLAINYPLTTINYSYDALSRLTNMADRIGTTAFAWTAGGQVASEDGPWANDTVSYGYSQRQQTSMSINLSQNFVYSYGAARRMAEITSAAGTFDYSYQVGQNLSPAFLVRGISLPNYASISNHFDAVRRLDYTALADKWGHVLDGYAYTHDPLGLRTNIVREFGLTTNGVSLGYDNIGEVILASGKEQDGTLRQNEQVAWVYDAAHNLRFRTNGVLAQTFTVDPANEVTNVTRNGTLTVSGNTPAPATNVTVNGSAAERYGDFTFAATNQTLTNGQNSITNIARNVYGQSVTNIVAANLPSTVNLNYDSNENVTNDGTRSFIYGPENELTNITLAGQWKTEFVYDGLGRRRIEKDYGWSGMWVQTNEVHFIYDRRLLAQERGSNNAVLLTYTRGLDLRHSLRRVGGIGGLLARTDTNGSTFYHADGAGNVTALLDGAGNIVARYLYDPFGRLIGRWGALADANTMGFSSMPRHRSGVVLYARRAYEPNWQRWLGADPIGIRGGFNLHRFVGNNPLRYVDPWGLDGEPREGADDDLEINGEEPQGEITMQILAELEGNLGNDVSELKPETRETLLDELKKDYVDPDDVAIGPDPAAQPAPVPKPDVPLPPCVSQNAPPKGLVLNGDKYPQSAANLEESGKVGVPLPVNRAGATDNRSDALQGLPKIPGYDLDEAPPAMFRNPGDPAVVRPAAPSDNRGAGASLGNQARDVPDGGQVMITIQRGSSP